MKVPRTAWPALRPLMHDANANIAALACQICLDQAPAAERPDAIQRLLSLLAQGDWMLREEIETCLVSHFDKTLGAIERQLNSIVPSRENAASRRLIESSLRRVTERAQAVAKSY